MPGVSQWDHLDALRRGETSSALGNVPGGRGGLWVKTPQGVTFPRPGHPPATSLKAHMSFKAQSLDYFRKDFAYRYHVGDAVMCAKTYAAVRQLASELIAAGV